MINIKDFEVGKKAILLDKSYRKESVSEVEVEKVGRKYVTVQLNRWCKREFEVSYSPYMLCEKTTYSPNMFLFPSEKSYQEYLEIKKLERSISIKLGSISNRFSLNALREIVNAIDKVIEESEGEE